jgi:peptidoglycan hydrolase CwlO-like protein
MNNRYYMAFIMSILLICMPLFSENFVVKKVRQVTVSFHDQCIESLSKVCEGIAECMKEAGLLLHTAGSLQTESLRLLAQEIQCGNASLFHQSELQLKELEKQLKNITKEMNALTRHAEKVRKEIEHMSKKIAEKK